MQSADTMAILNSVFPFFAHGRNVLLHVVEASKTGTPATRRTSQ